MIWYKIGFVVLCLAYALLDAKRHSEIINSGQSPAHRKEFIIRLTIGALVLWFVSFNREWFVWYWTALAMVLIFWPTFNMGLNRFRRPKKPWMYLDGLDEVEDSWIDRVIQRFFNPWVFGMFLIIIGVAFAGVFIFYGELTWEQINKY